MSVLVIGWAQPFSSSVATPVITSLTPTVVSALSLVRIKGTDFSPLSSENVVTVGGLVAASRTRGENLIEFLVPDGLPLGEHAVMVITRGIASPPVPLTLVESEAPPVVAGLIPTLDLTPTVWQGRRVPRSALQFRVGVGGETIFPGALSPYRGLFPPLFFGSVPYSGVGIGSDSPAASLYADPVAGRLATVGQGLRPDLAAGVFDAFLGATARGIVRIENQRLNFFPFPPGASLPLFLPTFIPHPAFDVRFPVGPTNPLVTDSIIVVTPTGVVQGPLSALAFIPFPPDVGSPVMPPVPERNPQLSIAPHITGSAQPFLGGELIVTRRGLLRLSAEKLTFTPFPEGVGVPVGPPVFECNASFSPRFGESGIGLVGEPFPFTGRIWVATGRGLVSLSGEAATFIPVPEGAGRVVSQPSCLVNPAFSVSPSAPTLDTLRFFQPGLVLAAEKGLVIVTGGTATFLPLPPDAGRVISPPLPMLNPDFSPFSPSASPGARAHPFLEGIVVATSRGIALFGRSQVAFLPVPPEAGQVLSPPTFSLNAHFNPAYTPDNPAGSPLPNADELFVLTSNGVVRIGIRSLIASAESPLAEVSSLGETEFVAFPSGVGLPLLSPIPVTLPGSRTTLLIVVSNGVVTVAGDDMVFAPVAEEAGSVLGAPKIFPTGEMILSVTGGLVLVDKGIVRFFPLPGGSGPVVSSPTAASHDPAAGPILAVTTNGIVSIQSGVTSFLPLPPEGGEPIVPAIRLTSVVRVNRPPVAEAGSDRTVEAAVATVFDASGSQDPDGTIVSYFWDFGDGTTARGKTVTHSYAGIGVFTVTLTVTDDEGETAIDRVRVTVVDTTPPLVKILFPSGGEIVPAGGTLTIRWTAFDAVGIVGQDILVAPDGISFTLQIAANLPGAVQSFDWSVPTTLQASSARLRIIARDGSGNTGQAESLPFTIRDTQPPRVTVLSPTGGETIPTGGSFLIRWISSDNIGVVRHDVLLAPDGVQFTTVLASGLPGTAQQFLWLVPPSFVAPRARIRVVARDGAGNEASSESGFFTVQDTIAPTVTITFPSKGQTFNAGAGISIRWQSLDNIAVVSQDILFSTDGGISFPTVVASGLGGNQTSFFWTIPVGAITSSARLRITARDAAGNIGQAETGNFVIRDATPPSVFVTRPRAGETINPGTSFSITWDSSDNVGVISHDILLSLNGGRNFSITIISGLGGDVRSFAWTVPGTIETNQARIRVVAYDASGNAGFDDTGNFTIRDTLPPTVLVHAPQTGETVNPATIFPIRWNSSDNVQIVSHDIQFSTNGGQTFVVLAAGLSGIDQHFDWNVPIVNTTQARLRITARDAAGNIGVGETGNFTIRDTLGPTVSVVQPTRGQTVSPATTLIIEWTSVDNLGVTSHEIRFSSNGCTSFPMTIVTGLPGHQQSFPWNIPADINTTRACLRVIARDAAGNIGQGDSGLFSIRDTVNPSVTLLAPTGGETLAGGSEVTIRWTSSDNIAVVAHDVLFSANGGASFSPLASGLGGTQQSLPWTVPNTLITTRAQIRIIARDSAGNTAQATSGNFAITDVTPPQVTVTRPAAGEVVPAGRSTTIRWVSSDTVGVTRHDIFLSTDGGSSFSQTLATNLAGTQQTFIWNVPASLASNQAVIRVVARDSSGNSGQGDSGVFIIQPPAMPPTVRLLAPNGGEVIPAGSVFTIRWISSDDRGLASHDLLLSTDGGQSFPFTIRTGLPGSAQSFVWSVPSSLGTTQARIRVVAHDTDGLTAQDDSDGNFTIERPAPPAGERLLVAADEVTLVVGLPSQPTLFATIPTRGTSRRLAVAPNGRFALAANTDTSVSLILDLDTPNPRETRLLTVGQGPTAIAISTDSTFAVTANGEALPLTISLIRDLPTAPTVRTVTLGTTSAFAGAQDIALSRSGDLAFIPVSAGVLVIEGLRTQPFPTFRTLVPIVQGTPTSIALSPDETTAYVATMGPDQIVVVRGITGARPTIAERVTTGLGRSPRALRLTPDGRRLVVTNTSSNDVSVYRVAGEELTLLAKLPVGARPAGIALLPDGSLAVIANTGDRTLSLIQNLGGENPTVLPSVIGPAPELATDRNAVQSLVFLPR